jgi:L-iditol 2-dehydrogenase
VVSDISSERLRVAEAMGATNVSVAGSGDDLGGFDAFIDCSGAAAAIDNGVRSVRPSGTVVLVGMGTDTLSLPFGIVQRHELRITGTFRYANTWPTALKLATVAQVNLEALVTGTYSLEHTEAALRSGSQAGHIKSVVCP